MQSVREIDVHGQVGSRVTPGPCSNMAFSPALIDVLIVVLRMCIVGVFLSSNTWRACIVDGMNMGTNDA